MSILKKVVFYSFLRNNKTNYSQNNNNFVRKVRGVSKDRVVWYPGHIHKGVESLKHKLGEADAVIEVHDCRLPFTGRTELLNTFGQVKPKILILNKVDLICPEDIKGIKRRLYNDMNESGDSSTNLVFAQLNNQKGLFKLLEHIHDIILDKLSTTSKVKGESNILVTGIPNVGKSTLINCLRNWNARKFGFSKFRASKPTAVGPHAGVTRAVSHKILINDGPPRIYVLDSPGIWEPKKEDLKAVLKMALCGCFNFNSLYKEIVIDFMLYWLNKHGHLNYVDFYKMEEPTDDIVEFVLKVCSSRGFVTKASKVIFGQDYAPDLTHAYEQIFKDFNAGSLGRFVMDDLDQCEESQHRNINSLAFGTIIPHRARSKSDFPFVWE